MWLIHFAVQYKLAVKQLYSSKIKKKKIKARDHTEKIKKKKQPSKINPTDLVIETQLNSYYWDRP